MKRKNKPSLLKQISKKVIKTLPVLSIAALVIYVGVLVKDVELPVMLPVTNVEVLGELNFLDKEQLEAIVISNVTGGYFTVDLNKIHDKLAQQPWVKSVSLRRKWPASLDVSVSEHEPVAYWNNDGYINEDGEVFKPESIDGELGLPILNGPEGHHNNVWKFMNVLYQEMALLEYEIVRLDLDERRAWQLIVTANENVKVSSEIDMINVKLGRFDTEKRLQRFVRILPALVDKNGIKVIDMRYPNGFAVQIKET